MKPETKIKIGETVVDAKDLNHEEKIAFIEFAIHLAAPQLAKFLAGEVEEPQDEPYTEENDDLYFDLPPILTVKEAAEFLRVSTHTVYEMCRVYHGKFFPHFKIGNQIKIPRDKFVEWIKSGGINYYKDNVASEDSKRHTQKIKENKAENIAKSLSKNENSKEFETKEHEKKLEEKEVLNKKEASKYLGISTAKMSQLLKDEKVLYIKRDTRYIIPKIALDTYINSKGQVSWQDQIKKYSEHKCRILSDENILSLPVNKPNRATKQIKCHKCGTLCWQTDLTEDLLDFDSDYKIYCGPCALKVDNTSF